MLKKIMITFSLFILLITMNSYAAAKTCFVIKDVTKYSNSDKVTVNLSLENPNKDITNWSLDVKYDKSKLDFINSRAGKDLNATFKLAENLPSESRVAIGAVSFTGFKKAGIYYSLTFKIKDDSADIPLEINLREVSDSKGNSIICDVKNGKIIIPKDDEVKVEMPVEEKKQVKQELANFETKDVELLESIENIIISYGNVELLPEDELIYEIEHNDVLEVLDDGTMIPKKDGTTTVRIKLNGNIIGTVQINVQNGKVSKIAKVKNKDDFIPQATTDEEVKIDKLVEEYKLKYLAIQKREQQNELLVELVLVLTIITIILKMFLFFKKNRGGTK